MLRIIGFLILCMGMVLLGSGAALLTVAFSGEVGLMWVILTPMALAAFTASILFGITGYKFIKTGEL